MPIKEATHDITAIGGIPFYILTTLIFLALNLKQQAYQLILGFLVIYIIYFILRSLYFKPRPHKIPHKTWLQKIDANSFPSAHAMRITVLGIVLAIFFNNVFITLITVITIILAGITRVTLKKHYWLDVIAGWIIGILISISIFKII
jgi:membrane-associated phospholipid phosphatase